MDGGKDESGSCARGNCCRAECISGSGEISYGYTTNESASKIPSVCYSRSDIRACARSDSRFEVNSNELQREDEVDTQRDI